MRTGGGLGFGYGSLMAAACLTMLFVVGMVFVQGPRGAGWSLGVVQNAATLDPQTRPFDERPSEQEKELQRKQERDLRKSEYEETKKMSDDLVKAATELKAMVEKAGENTLPLQAVRKVDEIEALSKKIRSRLKGSR